MKTEYPSQAPEAVRKRIKAPKTNVEDDSVSVEYNQTNDRVIVAHTEDENNISQIQADDRGVWYHKQAGGSWTTVPNAINVGGTGATNADDARTNLGLNPITFNVTAASGVTIQTNGSFRMGKVAFLALQIRITADNVTTACTIPAGSRPRTSVYFNMFNENTAVQSAAINTAGNVLVGGTYSKNVTYRLNVAYVVA